VTQNVVVFRSFFHESDSLGLSSSIIQKVELVTLKLVEHSYGDSWFNARLCGMQFCRFSYKVKVNFVFGDVSPATAN
jgi:hypothetical protein